VDDPRGRLLAPSVIAVRASVTESIAALTSGMLSSSPRARRLFVSTLIRQDVAVPEPGEASSNVKQSRSLSSSMVSYSAANAATSVLEQDSIGISFPLAVSSFAELVEAFREAVRGPRDRTAPLHRSIFNRTALVRKRAAVGAVARHARRTCRRPR